MNMSGSHQSTYLNYPGLFKLKELRLQKHFETPTKYRVLCYTGERCWEAQNLYIRMRLRVSLFMVQMWYRRHTYGKIGCGLHRQSTCFIFQNCHISALLVAWPCEKDVQILEDGYSPGLHMRRTPSSCISLHYWADSEHLAVSNG